MCLVGAVLSFVFVFGSVSVASAQDYPTKAIRFVVPFPPGGTTDFLARLLGQAMEKDWRQPVVVENKTGAGGIVGAEAVARSAPDGYTIGMIIPSHASNPSLYSKLPYDSEKDFAPVTLLIKIPLLVVVNSSGPVKSMEELIALAKAKPGTLTFGSTGVGSGAHLTTELFKSITGTNMVHVPYRGAGPYIAALVAGEIDVAFGDAAALLPQVRAGKLRPLAVTSAQRLAALPDVPTMIEAGVADFESTTWAGVLAPAGTPVATVKMLQTEMTHVLELPDVRKRISDLAAEPVGNTSAEFAAFLRTETVRWGAVVKASGAKAD